MQWYLDGLRSTGLTPMAGHRAWVADFGIPVGDRSVYEHQVIMKVLEVGACLDQLNLPALISMELLGRRAQVIEAAHAHNPSNPDYSMAEAFMGWGVQRGGALVAPQLTRMAATKAREKSEMMKETRKMQEEMRLRRPAQSGDEGSGDSSRGRGRGRGRVSQ